MHSLFLLAYFLACVLQASKQAQGGFCTPRACSFACLFATSNHKWTVEEAFACLFAGLLVASNGGFFNGCHAAGFLLMFSRAEGVLPLRI